MDSVEATATWAPAPRAHSGSRRVQVLALPGGWQPSRREGPRHSRTALPRPHAEPGPPS